MSQSLLLEMYAIALFLTAMAYYKHRENIVRLLIKGRKKNLSV
ncbi:hypothetical protein [Kineothrix sp. MB12-C1]|nr:hypothetical protein [Kineothrix sp. MB12-C1]WMC92717.1 hypothetical protein RBB56_00010 [Kineothrix sp. MB12-C1]